MIWRRGFHFRRYRQIADVLARHGLSSLIGVLGLTRFMPVRRGVFGRPGQLKTYTTYTPPQHLRMALEELGTTFIKLGQMLSTRPDLLPPDYQAELAKLQDAAPPFPFEAVRDAIYEQWGRPIESIFATFEEEPLAAASIGQVHAATLADGSHVVVKIRRPGVVEQVEEDLQIVQNLAVAASRRWQLADQYDIIGLSLEFARTLRAELDYLQEGRNAERFLSNFAGDPRVHIPKVYWEYTTSNILTLERIEGIKISDLGALDRAGIDRHELAERAAQMVLKMIFDDGFFHADPHPGNFFIEPTGRLGLIDFGMVGVVDERTQDQLSDVVLALANQDADRLMESLLDLGIANRRINRDQLRRDLEHMMAKYYGRPLGEIDIGPAMEDVLAIVRRYRLQLPSNLALLARTIMMNEGLGARLDPDFRLPIVLIPFARRILVRQFSPVRWAKQFSLAGVDMARLSVNLPQHLRRIINDVERGGLEVGVRPEGFEPLIRRFERIANRIVLGIIAAAFIIGLSILVSVYRPPGWDRWAGAVFVVGFAFAGGLGAYLAWTILRSGRG